MNHLNVLRLEHRSHLSVTTRCTFRRFDLVLCSCSSSCSACVGVKAAETESENVTESLSPSAVINIIHTERKTSWWHQRKGQRSIQSVSAAVSCGKITLIKVKLFSDLILTVQVRVNDHAFIRGVDQLRGRLPLYVLSVLSSVLDQDVSAVSM